MIGHEKIVSVQYEREIVTVQHLWSRLIGHEYGSTVEVGVVQKTSPRECTRAGHQRVRPSVGSPRLACVLPAELHREAAERAARDERSSTCRMAVRVAGRERCHRSASMSSTAFDRSGYAEYCLIDQVFSNDRRNRAAWTAHHPVPRKWPGETGVAGENSLRRGTSDRRSPRSDSPVASAKRGSWVVSPGRANRGLRGLSSTSPVAGVRPVEWRQTV